MQQHTTSVRAIFCQSKIWNKKAVYIERYDIAKTQRILQFILAAF